MAGKERRGWSFVDCPQSVLAVGCPGEEDLTCHGPRAILMEGSCELLARNAQLLGAKSSREKVPGEASMESSVVSTAKYLYALREGIEGSDWGSWCQRLVAERRNTWQ